MSKQSYILKKLGKIDSLHDYLRKKAADEEPSTALGRLMDVLKYSGLSVGGGATGRALSTAYQNITDPAVHQGNLDRMSELLEAFYGKYADNLQELEEYIGFGKGNVNKDKALSILGLDALDESVGPMESAYRKLKNSFSVLDDHISPPSSGMVSDHLFNRYAGWGYLNRYNKTKKEILEALDDLFSMDNKHAIDVKSKGLENKINLARWNAKLAPEHIMHTSPFNKTPVANTSVLFGGPKKLFKGFTNLKDKTKGISTLAGAVLLPLLYNRLTGKEEAEKYVG